VADDKRISWVKIFKDVTQTEWQFPIMRNIMAKTDIAPKVAPHSIDETIAALEKRRSELTVGILNLEARGVKLADDRPPPAAHTRALAMLNGFAPAALKLGNSGTSLRDLYDERVAIEIAIEIGRRQNFMAHAELLAAEIRKTKDTWAAITLRRFRALSELRAANVAAEKFKERLALITGIRPSLPADSFKLMGHADVVGDEFYRFTEAAVAAGIITPKEAQNARKPR
jgi:hypothetical protein